jgi:hypothetical protein
MDVKIPTTCQSGLGTIIAMLRASMIGAAAPDLRQQKSSRRHDDTLSFGVQEWRVSFLRHPRKCQIAWRNMTMLFAKKFADF